MNTTYTSHDLDRLIAEKVFKLASEAEIPWYSSKSQDMWRLVEKISCMVGDYAFADGFFELVYGEAAGHQTRDDCRVEDPDVQEDGTDPAPWSCHLHLGLLAADQEYPQGWDHGQAFCARGATAGIALCRAVLRAYGVDDV